MTVRKTDITTCRSCGASIAFVLTTGGKRMPIDVEPSDKGTLFVFAPLPTVALSAESVTARSERAELARTQGRERYVSHFATCPQAAQHRKPR